MSKSQFHVEPKLLTKLFSCLFFVFFFCLFVCFFFKVNDLPPKINHRNISIGLIFTGLVTIGDSGET